MRKICYYLLFLSSVLNAQVKDNFSDGELFHNPMWLVDTTQWTIINGQLRSDASISNDTFYLSTPSFLISEAQWEFYLNLKFATSGSNYADIYLVCDTSNLKSKDRNGYFVRVGNTSDEIALYSCVNGKHTKMINGVNGQTNSSDNIFKIKVTCDVNHLWTLKRDSTGTGFYYVSEGTAVDTTTTTSSYFGISIRQSSASFHRKHFFDEIEVKPLIVDTVPPSIFSLQPVSSNQLDILFNEYMDERTSQDTINYRVDNGIGTPTEAIRDTDNPAMVHLTFLQSFADSVSNKLTIDGVKDLEKNAIRFASEIFTYYPPETPGFKDVIINELFPDPFPQVSLPEAEFVEVYNRSAKIFNLRYWLLADASGYSTITIEDDTLLPGEYMIICSEGDTTLFSHFGRVIGMKDFPSLNNTGDDLYLLTDSFFVVDSVNYSNDWYQDNKKKEGGWTIELANKDVGAQCPAYVNWKASVNVAGGTPGKLNSVDTVDRIRPQLQFAKVISADTIQVVFSEPIDTFVLTDLLLYEVNHGVGYPTSAHLVENEPNAVILVFPAELQKGIVYTITLNRGIRDCAGNSIDLDEIDFVIPQSAEKNDLVINEVLSDPNKDGVDFVEIYNRSNKIIDLKTIFVALYDTILQVPLDKKTISATTRLIYPEEYIVISEDSRKIEQQYDTPYPNTLMDIDDLPFMNVAHGAICLVSITGAIDYFQYDQKMHFDLLNDTKGVSLERIDFDRPTNERTNWHSASQTVGFATPGYENSQYQKAVYSKGGVALGAKLFSPDEDGVQDVLDIHYHFEEAGYVGTIIVYDSKGTPVRYLVKNELLGSHGTYSWDGINEMHEKARIGIYIIFFEAYDLLGNSVQFKKPVVLAGKL